jgi:hypothetical protein
MAGNWKVSRLLSGDMAAAANLLDKEVGVMPSAFSPDGRGVVAATALPVEKVWWPTVYSATGVNALVSAALVGTVIPATTGDTLTLLADPTSAESATRVPPLQSSAWGQTPMIGKPRVATGQPVLVVPGSGFGRNSNNIDACLPVCLSAYVCMCVCVYV